VADTPTLETFTVTGTPIFGNPFDQDAPPGFVGGGLSLNEAAAAQEAQYPGAPQEPTEAFAPPPPVLPPQLLPEVVVQAPSVVGSILTGFAALLFPQPTGPARYDEAPTPPGIPPPPDIPVEFAEPQLPPNWNDLANEPFDPGTRSVPWGDLVRIGVDLLRRNLPGRTPDVTGPGSIVTTAFPADLPLLDEFVLSPPQPTRQPSIIEVPFTDPAIFLEPYGIPDFGIGTGPGSAPAPFESPGVDPTPGRPGNAPSPGRPVQPQPTDLPAIDLLGTPLPNIFVDPIGDPVVTPSLPTRPGPSTRTPSDGIPADDPTSFLNPVAQADPLAMFDNAPTKPPSETCSCDKKPKKKEKKKRENRNECWRGTYVQHTRGISYVRKEQVPCEAAPRKKAAKKGKTPTWQDTINDVFQLP